MSTSPPVQQHSFTDYSATYPDTPHRGDWLDQEYAELRRAATETLSQIALIQRSDGSLAIGIVNSENLATSLYDEIVADVTPDLQPYVDQCVAARDAAQASATAAADSADLAAQSANTATGAASTAVQARNEAVAAATAAGNAEADVAADAISASNSANHAAESEAYAYDYAVVAGAWAEYTEGPIPPNILAVMGITGDHWSSRWWANQALKNAKETVPVGGATGQVLKKASNQDYDLVWTEDLVTPLPTGGAAGQVLKKASGNNYDVYWGNDQTGSGGGGEIPVGGSAGQVLKKLSATDYDVVWSDDLTGGGGALPSGGTTGQVLKKASNADGDATWQNDDKGREVPLGGTTGQVLKKASNVDGDYTWQADAIGSVIPSGGAAGTVLKKNTSADGDYSWQADLQGGNGDVTGPSSATVNRIAVFSNSTGKVIADGGKAIADLANAVHGHTISDVTGLQGALDNKQPLDALLTALAGNAAASGLMEFTGADAYTTRAVGVGAATSVPTRADADARYAALSHGHAIADVTGLQTALDGKQQIGVYSGITQVTASRLIATTDVGKIICLAWEATGSVTLTIPTDDTIFPNGFRVDLTSNAANVAYKLIIAAESGINLRSSTAKYSIPQYGAASLIKMWSTFWILTGALE